MSDVPHEVLSEHFQDRISGKRLLAAVFTAFQFDPGFFEQEILPVFLDVNLSHASAIKLVQLEDCLRSLPGAIAVYYDANGLVQSGDGSAKLDIRRVPVRVATGIFHPKNVFALLEATQPDENGQRPRTLLVASLSANLTKSGWWQNVEACHVEELVEGAPTNLRADLLDFFTTIRRRSPAAVDHDALDQIAAFVRRLEQRPNRSADGRLHPHFFAGGAFDEYLHDAFGAIARGWNLEVISPYFDDDETSRPLEALIRRFRPREVRVLLPRNEAGEALCPQAMYESIRAMDDVSWGALPRALLRSGKGEDARPRSVHAKVYRFFTPHPKREILVVGSVNLTRPAHQAGGNVESALIVEIDPPRRPEFWLEEERTKPTAFARPDVEEDGGPAVDETGSRLCLRYWWDLGKAEALWDAPRPSDELTIEAGGVELFRVRLTKRREWHALDATASAELQRALVYSSFVVVQGDRPEAVSVLVQEEGMWKKPPLLSSLSIRDILRYWSLLTAEQRNDFIQLRAAEILGDASVSDLVSKYRAEAAPETIFDRYAGTFHAFSCLEASVRQALQAGNEKEALYRLFGMKHDSLGSLLKRVRDDGDRDVVDRYIIALCARQMLRELRRAFPEFWATYARDADELEQLVGFVDAVRQTLSHSAPDMPDFLAWFEGWFLRRAQPLKEVV